MREMDGGAAVFFFSSFLEFCRFSPNFLAVFSWFSRSFLSFSHSFLLVFNCEKTQENEKKTRRKPGAAGHLAELLAGQGPRIAPRL